MNRIELQRRNDTLKILKETHLKSVQSHKKAHNRPIELRFFYSTPNSGS